MLYLAALTVDLCLSFESDRSRCVGLLETRSERKVKTYIIARLGKL
jgi:hypothetical protein